MAPGSAPVLLPVLATPTVSPASISLLNSMAIGEAAAAATAMGGVVTCVPGTPGGGTIGTAPAPTSTDALVDVYVWGRDGGVRENLVSAYGDVISARLPIRQGATEPENQWVRVTGKTKLAGTFSQEAFPGGNNLLTRDGFDQIQTLFALTSLVQFLERLGFDMTKILGPWKPMVARVNSVADLNAWFHPGTGEMSFGTAEKSRFGEWHLASDMDIVRHEAGHLTLHRINPQLVRRFAGDGGAIHEGFADAMAALLNGDSHVGEDFPANTGRMYGTDIGLRDVSDILKYSDAGREVHSLGRVYGGFWWSVAVALAPLLGGNFRMAADLTAAFLANHGVHYATTKPGPADFVDTAIVGAKAYLEGNPGKYVVTHDQVRETMTAEARRRGMLQTLQRGERLGPNLNLVRWLANFTDPFAFVVKAVTNSTFGGRIFLQQFFMKDATTPVELLGSGLIVFTDQSGATTGYSTTDVRSSMTRVPPAVLVTAEQAYQAVKAEAARLVTKSTSEVSALDKLAPTSRSDEHRLNLAVDRAEMERRAAEIAHQEALVITDPAQHTSLVMIPEGPKDDMDASVPYWRFELGFSTFYVNARTGHLAVWKMPMW